MIRWGILGPGSIARKFATGLRTLPQAQLAAVASREVARAREFAAEFGAFRAYGSYEALIADPAIDIVYIATPHVFHCEQSLLCLNGGKAVLCEKPLCVNEAEARRVVETARANRCFLMEAMWTRFFPLMERLQVLLAEGEIGDLRLLTADFGFPGDPDPASRLWNPTLGGGGLLDVGVYPLSLAQMLLGEPQKVLGLAQLAETGVDEQAAWLLEYSGGRMASGCCSIQALTLQEAHLSGTRGAIRIHAPWWRPSGLTVHKPDGTQHEWALPYAGNGYQYEAAAAMECLERGALEHPLMTHEASLAVMRTLDRLRSTWVASC